jgi:hypothetical protein
MNLVCCHVLAMALGWVGVDGSLSQDQVFPTELRDLVDPTIAIFGTPTSVKPGMTRDQALTALKKDGYAVEEILNRRADLWSVRKSAAGFVRTIWVTFKGEVVAAADDWFISD